MITTRGQLVQLYTEMSLRRNYSSYSIRLLTQMNQSQLR